MQPFSVHGFPLFFTPNEAEKSDQFNKENTLMRGIQVCFHNHLFQHMLPAVSGS